MKSDLLVSARLPVEDVKALEAMAKAEDRTRSAELRRAVRVYLEVSNAKATA